METRALTRQEIKAVLNKSSDGRDKALLVLGFNSGYRISELLSLQIGGVIVVKGDQVRCRDVIKIDKANMKGKKRDRAIRLNTDAKNELLSYFKALLSKGLGLDAPLFGGRKNGLKTAITRQTAWRILKCLAELALGDSEGVGTHSLRKSFATHLYLKTRDIYRVSAMLGHAFVTTTERYIKGSIALMDSDLDELCLT